LLRGGAVTRRTAVLLLGRRRCVSVVAVGAVSWGRSVYRTMIFTGSKELEFTVVGLLRRVRLLLFLLLVTDTKVLKLLGDLLEERHNGRLRDGGSLLIGYRMREGKRERGR
jgi:hypothetical protein